MCAVSTLSFSVSLFALWVDELDLCIKCHHIRCALKSLLLIKSVSLRCWGHFIFPSGKWKCHWDLTRPLSFSNTRKLFLRFPAGPGSLCAHTVYLKYIYPSFIPPLQRSNDMILHIKVPNSSVLLCLLKAVTLELCNYPGRRHHYIL